MFNSLKNHTAGQMSNLPQTLSDASSLAGMNAQFGEQKDSCSFFNEILEYSVVHLMALWILSMEFLTS